MTKLFRRSRNMRFIIISTDHREASAVSASALARTGKASLCGREAAWTWMKAGGGGRSGRASSIIGASSKLQI
eukprot:3958399-Amphidinium_carterae.2